MHACVQLVPFSHDAAGVAVVAVANATVVHDGLICTPHGRVVTAFRSVKLPIAISRCRFSGDVGISAVGSPSRGLFGVSTSVATMAISRCRFPERVRGDTLVWDPDGARWVHVLPADNGSRKPSPKARRF
jgi:hypothetical protein